MARDRRDSQIGGAPGGERSQGELRQLRNDLALSEAACCDAERRYTALFEGSRDAIIVTDRRGRVVEANGAALELWAYSRREMLGLDCRELHPDPEELETIFHPVIEKGFTDDLEVWSRRKDGTPIRCLVSVSTSLSESGRKTGFLGVVHDITGRLATEEALRRSEETYRSLFEESQDVVYITSRDGGMIDISRSASELFGYSKEELLTMDVRGLYAFPEDRRRFQAEIEKSGAVRAFPVRLSNRSGGTRYCLLTSTVRRGPDGTTIGYHGIIRDVTDQRKAERARTRERSAFRVIAESAVRADGLEDLCSRVLEGLLSTYGFDFGTVRLYDEKERTLSPTATTGFSEEEIHRVGVQHIDDSGTTASLVARTGVPIFAPDAVKHDLYTSHGPRLDGLGVRALVSNPLVGPKGELVGVLQLAAREPRKLGPEDRVVFQTVAEMFAAVIGRTRALVEKDEIHAQLLQAQKLEAIGTLASGVAHDFNNILTAIQGFADLALMSVDSSQPLADDIEKIRSSAERGAKLVRQLLMFSRRQPVEFGSIDLNSTTQGLTKMLTPLIGEDVSMAVALERDIWRVTADEAGMQQIVMNLAVNARDAMPEGGALTIRTQNVELSEADCSSMADSRPGSFVRLSVIDTGSGMDAETVSRIFEPFFSTKGPAKGTGLGLSVVYGIVQQHHGWAFVESEPGRGTAFHIYIPAEPANTDNEPAPRDVDERATGNGERILVVEDEHTVRDLAVRVLRQNGYEVFEAASVGDALEVVERESGRLDLIFSDVVLPDRSGVQLARILSETRPDLPVLLSSGHADERSQYEAIREGEMPFLPKPYSLPDLLKAVRGVIRPA